MIHNLSESMSISAEYISPTRKSFNCFPIIFLSYLLFVPVSYKFVVEISISLPQLLSCQQTAHTLCFFQSFCFLSHGGPVDLWWMISFWIHECLIWVDLTNQETIKLCPDYFLWFIDYAWVKQVYGLKQFSYLCLNYHVLNRPLVSPVGAEVWEARLLLALWPWHLQAHPPWHSCR